MSFFRDPSPSAATRSLAWPHGRAELQRLGAMLAPVVFRAAGAADFAPLQVAPWADEPGAAQWPGILRRLRGEWPCVPFGRTDRPADLPAGWAAREPGDAWGHGHAANHAWDWLELDDALALGLTIEAPAPLRRLTRTVRAEPDTAALAITLRIEVQQPCTLPVALHPTVRLDLGALRLDLPARGPVLSYPVDAEPGISRLAPDACFESLAHAPLRDGSTVDLTRFPLAHDSEELLQVRDVDGPVELHCRDAGWTFSIDWDRALLPDVMLWVSHRGRRQPPWNGRHFALGIEPLCGPFDLGRVAVPPASHALADRRGLVLTPDVPLELHYRLAARPHATT